ncbi:MAG: histone deacetylase [Bacteroidota bacterium]
MKTAITFSTDHEGHSQAGHVERPERLHTIVDLLNRDGILEKLVHIDAPLAEAADVTLVHPYGYFDRVEAAVEAGGTQLDPDTYATPHSLRVALQALGGLLAITDAVVTGEVTNGFAAVRPPGHHARPDEAMGFCLFANVAIAARKALQDPNINKVLIIDFDVHHGNGTQEIFYDDPDVMYMSTHQAPLYPGTGALQETGTGAGEGTTVNIPLPAYTGDADFLHAFRTMLTPKALAFNPDLIFISAGYDAHWMDLVGGLNLTVIGFAEIVREILQWADTCCDSKVVALLEGGYNADALAHCVLTTLQLLQDPNANPSDPFGSANRPNADLSGYMEKLIAFHS